MSVLDALGASCGPLDVTGQMVDDVSLGPSLASTWRRNPLLPVSGHTQFLQRGCVHNPVRGWPDPCVTGEPAVPVKCSADCMELSPVFQSGSWYFVSEVPCAQPGYDLEASARDVVEQQTMVSLARELADGGLTGSPSLQSVGRDLTPAAGPVSVTQGLAILFNAYARMSVIGFTLYVPWTVLPFLATKGVLTQRGGLIATVGGVTLDSSAGYTGVAPLLDALGAPKLVPPDVTAPERGEVTIYATKSAVEYNVGPVEFYGGGVQFDHLTNSSMVEAMRRGIARFNTSCVFGVTVRLDDPGCAGD